jgi:thiamine transport system ATP-binding protein
VAVLRDGRVEQVGDPRAVYRRPATRFVASFVGDNNLFDGRVVGVDDSRVAVRVGDRQFAVARHSPADGAIRPDDGVTVCVRPEHLRIVGGTGGDAHDGGDRGSAPTANRFPATVRESEFLGATTRVHCEWDGRPVVVTHDDALSGDVTLGFDPADARLLVD